MTNLARAILALVLRAVFGGAKSCALVSLFMICPPMVSWWLSRPLVRSPCRGAAEVRRAAENDRANLAPAFRRGLSE
jgi:hypothetical protein